MASDELNTGRTQEAATLAIGDGHTCSLAQGQLKCWGRNFSGQLGQGDATDRGKSPSEMGAGLRGVDLGKGRKVVQADAGADQTCAVLDNGTLKCWGENGGGQLGLGDNKNRGAEPGEMGDALPAVDLGPGRVLEVSVGQGHACARLDGGRVKCWGGNEHGALGLGDKQSRGAKPGDMGEALPSVDLGTGRSAVAIATGRDFSCAILDDGGLKCWGMNTVGQLGAGPVRYLGDEPGEMGDALPLVDLGARRVIAISAGLGSACALADSGVLKCWGYETANGQPGEVGNSEGGMGNALLPIDVGSHKVVSFALGAKHGCAALDDGAVKCWGDPWLCGSGEARTRYGVEGNLPTVNFGGGFVTEVVAGVGHSCARFKDDSIKCWGDNSAGQLGAGRGDPYIGDLPGEVSDMASVQVD